jgi:hypothetical protein
MQVASPIEPDPKAAELTKPGEAALDGPATGA